MKIKIDAKSMIKKGVPQVEDKWGVYFVTGFQGSGKTYFAVYYTLKINNIIIGHSHSNVSVLNIVFIPSPQVV